MVKVLCYKSEGRWFDPFSAEVEVEDVQAVTPT